MRSSFGTTSTRKTLLLATLVLGPLLARGTASSNPLTVVDVQNMRLVSVPSDSIPGATREADVVILGGGLGGVAAALAACDAGLQVILTEETDWLGGQATAQGVSALDENPWIERSGGTRTYQDFRKRIRGWYQTHARLTPQARQTPELDPGNSWVSKLTFEPKVAVAVIDEMLDSHRKSGKLTLLTRHKVIRAHRTGRSVDWVDVVILDQPGLVRLAGKFFLDATELGDGLLACGVEHVVGAESKQRTGEPHARDDGAHPECVQSFTYPFALRLKKVAAPPIVRPSRYEQNREVQAYTFKLLYPERGWIRYGVFEQAPGSYGPFWTYRRLIDCSNFDDPQYAEDVAMINWPGNDYRGRSLLVESPQEVLLALREAKELASGFCHWLQTEAPRDGGGAGYPEMVLDTAAMGTADGLAKYPYIRESRRVRAIYTIVQQDVAGAYQADRARGRHFGDSVGIGSYGIDIHANDAEKKLPPAHTKPFQIPMGALIPVDTDNFIPAGKNIGTTHITNGCYRLHPIEWNIGEAAGLLAAACIQRHEAPGQIQANPDRVLELQRELVQRGVPLFWYDDVGPGDSDFVEAQLAPFTRPAELERSLRTLHYRPSK